MAAISVEAVRKVSGLPASAESIIYVIVGIMYLFLLPGIRNRIRFAPDSLPVWLVLLSLWCLIEALIPRIPLGMALLGWASYVFYVPLLYIGAELFATDNGAAKVLRFVVISGGLLGLGAVASAVLGQSAPTILQPIVPSVGVHSFSTGNIYLAPSFFATAEQAAEELLIAFFAWIALAYLSPGRPGRAFSAILGVLITVGLFATERRADIAVALVGVLTLLVLSRRGHRQKAEHLMPRGTPRMHSLTAVALVLGAVGSLALLSFLGASKVLPFLTSRSEGVSALTLMFSPADPGSLAGQGTGTSAQGVGVLGATTFTGIHDNQPYAGYVQGGRDFITVEGGMTKTWLELGIVGVVLYAGIFYSALRPAVRSLSQLDAVGRTLGVLTIALGVVFLKGHASLDDPLVQPLFWLAAGGMWGRLRARVDGLPGRGPTWQASAGGHSYAAAPRAPLG